jgi:hypothetical protein
MPTESCYFENALRAYFAFPGLEINSIQIRIFAFMGDRTAAAILKVLYPLTVLDDVTLQKLLTAVRTSFESPGTIDLPLDRIPAVSLCLLEMLLAGSSPEQKNSIRTVIERLKQAPIAGMTTLCPCSG